MCWEVTASMMYQSLDAEVYPSYGQGGFRRLEMLQLVPQDDTYNEPTSSYIRGYRRHYDSVRIPLKPDHLYHL